MEYNSNTYLTIAHSDCDALGLDGTHRQNNTGDICIMEFASTDVIPEEIAAVMLATYTHQEALALVAGSEWVSEMPI
jgi:hypothetical protein